MSSKRTKSKKLIKSVLQEQEEERNLDRIERERLDEELEEYDSEYRLWLEDEEKRLSLLEEQREEQECLALLDAEYGDYYGRDYDYDWDY